jgi:hypothetical protein
MAVTYGFFNSVNGDRKYNAEQMSEYFRGIINEGVYQHLDGGLAVTAGTGLAVNVAAGRAIIQNRWIQNSAAMPLTIAAASETYARKDAVVIRLNWSSRAISIAVKTGTPAASPVAPSMTRSSTTYEMALAYVNVAANATSVTVTDKRSDSTVCGWVTVAQSTSGEVDAQLNAMKTGFDGVTYASPATMVRSCDEKLQKFSVASDSLDWLNVHFIANNTASGDYADCDTYPINRSVMLSAVDSDHVAHLPISPFTGYLLTLNYLGLQETGNNNRNFSCQLAQDIRNNKLYYRGRYSSWTAWKEVDTEAEYTDLGIKIKNAIYTNNNIANTDYADLDTLPIGSIIFYSAVGSNLTHKPDGFATGYVITVNYNGFSGGSNRQFSVQYCHSCANNQNVVWYRSKYSSWTAWRMIGEQPTVLNAYKGLKNFTVLGDSISVSLSYPTMSPSYTVKSWATIMADSMDATAEIYAQGGRTTAAMLAASDYSTAVANANNNQFAIIALGINDANNEVSSATFKTNYTQLINDMLTHHKFVLCCTIPAGLKGDTRAQYNTDIKTVANSITNAFVVDVEAFSNEISPLCHLGHMSSVGYAALASFIEKAIDNTIVNNSYFIQGGIDE